MDEDAYGPGAYDWENYTQKGVMQHQGYGFMTYNFDTSVGLQKLVIREDMRRCGFGTELLSWLITQARKSSIAEIKSVVLLSNLEACLFLAHNGFASQSQEHGFVLFKRQVIIK